MSVDFRTRRDSEEQDIVDIDAFFSNTLAQALDNNSALLSAGIQHINFKSFSFDINGKIWSLVATDSKVAVVEGDVKGAAATKLSPEDFEGLVRDWYTPMTFFTGGSLLMTNGRLEDFLNCWLVLRGALDNRAIYAPGSISFIDRDAKPLNINHSFKADDDPEQMSHFLQEAGFLHIRNVFTEQEMAQVSQDMDAAAGGYYDGDGRSWWAETSDGQQRLVRMQYFSEYSKLAKKLLQDPRFLKIAELTGDGHIHQGLGDNKVEALIKPLNVVKGISDLPWHKDCSLGRHSYDCCSLTVGISVTGADANSGQLRVIAGSHRALMWPALVTPSSYDLPEIDLPTTTGDVTIHLSCTMHMAQAPLKQERRVMYTGFRLPNNDQNISSQAQARISAVREGAYTTVSQ